MGEHSVRGQLEGGELRAYMGRLLTDLQALERLLAEGRVEEGVRRVGAEQELFLVDRQWRPAPAALEVLERFQDPHASTELGLFNLELNLEPDGFGGSCLRNLEQQLDRLLGRLRKAIADLDLEIVLTGILPTISKSCLDLDMMTPLPRYRALNEAVGSLRGSDHELYMKGLDELSLKHGSVMLEACNTSFQVHFQVGAREFPNLYNIAQVVAAPVLAAATNSPMLFGRRLWHETRIALFQQAVDTRTSDRSLREGTPRVTFGQHWIQESVLELFREDVSRFRALVGSDDDDEDPMSKLDRGEVPELRTLCTYNSTVYRWNRACYGITDGKPHLRIENRVLPSGPTVLDEIANAAFWFGLISAFASRYEDITKMIDFGDAQMNFLAAARLGLAAQFTWFDGKRIPAQTLICDQLLDHARFGLERGGIDPADIHRYLGVIDERVRSGNTGSEWLLRSFAGFRGKAKLGEQLNALTAATVARQKGGIPVSRWKPALLQEAGDWKPHFMKVEQYMTTDLITVHEDEPVHLVANMMDWKHIRHVPVEDRDDRLVGLISYRTLLRIMARGWDSDERKTLAAADVMKKDPISVSPETSTLEAVQTMRQHGVDCLPVCRDGRLVGIVTERDFVDIAAQLLSQTFDK